MRNRDHRRLRVLKIFHAWPLNCTKIWPWPSTIMLALAMPIECNHCWAAQLSLEYIINIPVPVALSVAKELLQTYSGFGSQSPWCVHTTVVIFSLWRPLISVRHTISSLVPSIVLVYGRTYPLKGWDGSSQIAVSMQQCHKIKLSK